MSIQPRTRDPNVLPERFNLKTAASQDSSETQNLKILEMARMWKKSIRARFAIQEQGLDYCEVVVSNHLLLRNQTTKPRLSPSPGLHSDDLHELQSS